MANWNNPTLTSTYTNFVTEVKDRDIEAAVWFEGMSPTNLPTNAKRLNTTTGRFEKWNGAAWVDAVATFTFPALTVAGAATFNGNTTIGNAGTDTLTVNAAATFGAAAAFNGAVTLGDAAGDAVTVNGTLSFATAPVLTPGAANSIMFLNGSKVVSASGNLNFDGLNIGLGLTPTAWDAQTSGTIQNLGGALYRYSTTDIGIAQNAYFDGSWKYRVAASAGTYYIGSGVHVWRNAASGAAGAAISFNDLMTLNSTGLGLGLSPAVKLDVNGNIRMAQNFYLQSSDGAGGWVELIKADASNNTVINNNKTGTIIFVNSNVGERARFDTAGNLVAHSSVTGCWQLPRGTTLQRPTGASGMIRFNNDLNKYEGHNGSSWSSIGGGATGGGSDDIFHENGQTVTANYTITSSKNAMSAGPITIASGITVTLPSGSTWVVV